VCCVALNSPCLLDGDCCGPFSRCGDIGSSTLQCLQPLLPGAGACSRDVECLRGRCERGICQSNCDADVACANGTCVDGECCVDTGGLCAFDTDCCGVLTCQNNRCSSQVTR
jgi:hypothetical protein